MTPEQVRALLLGAHCAYTARIHRVALTNGRKEWRRTDLGMAIPCVYMGWRTLSEGVNDYTPEEGFVYVADRHLSAALVVYDARCKPVFVPFDALEVR